MLILIRLNQKIYSKGISLRAKNSEINSLIFSAVNFLSSGKGYTEGLFTRVIPNDGTLNNDGL